jgi:hypothetical protein
MYWAIDNWLLVDWDGVFEAEIKILTWGEETR